MHYNFDEQIERKGTSCYKYDLVATYFKEPDLLPMWVADMDFRTPDFILDALTSRLEHPVLGYSFQPDREYQAIIDWNRKRYGWNIRKEWIGFAPGVVPSLNLAVMEFTQPGDKIVIQTPVYFPFYSAVKEHGRELVLNPLRLNNGRYEMDMENLRQQIDEKTRMLILCSPHNPTGNVWHRDELEELATVCVEHNILIVSDEIHADIVYPGHVHIPISSISEEIARSTITLMSPSKTFNMAGLATSYYIASNEKLHERIATAVSRLHLNSGNIFGNTALEAAYRHGENWLTQLIDYLAGNVRFAKEFINTHLPRLQVIEPEATFLLWVDFRNSGMDDRSVREQLVKKARLALSNGILFGRDGAGFQRINIGCPRSILKEGLERMAVIFD